MRRLPVPASKNDLLETLRELVALVEADDSFEGSLEYLMPDPPPEHELVVQESPIVPGTGFDRPGIMYSCAECGLCVADDRAGLERVHRGTPLTTESGERTQFLLTAAYRVGNSMGQGGLRIIGDFG